MWTCNRLELQTLGFQPVMPKNLPITKLTQQLPHSNFKKHSPHALHAPITPNFSTDCRGLCSEIIIGPPISTIQITSGDADVRMVPEVPHNLHSPSFLSIRIGKTVEWSWVELSWTDRSGPEGFELSAEFCVCFYLKCAVAMAGESGKLQVFWDPHSQPSRAVVLFCRWVKNHRGKTRLSWSPLRQGWGWCA